MPPDNEKRDAPDEIFQRATERALQRYRDDRCREHLVIALDAAVRWFDFLRHEGLDAWPPLGVLGDLEDEAPGVSPTKRALAIAHANYLASEPQWPWDAHDDTYKQGWIKRATDMIQILDEQGLRVELTETD